jgi:hypothetical protein
MKQLSFIDCSENNSTSSTIEIRYNDDESISSKRGDSSFSLGLENLNDDLTWYYQQYLLHPFNQQYKKAKSIGKNIYEEGKKLGKSLIDDEILQKLSNINLKEVTVIISSDNAEFFKIPWEMLVLPGLNQTLSIEAKEFVRTDLNGFRSKTEYKLSTNNPLRILFVAPRPNEYNDCSFVSTPVNILNKMLEYEKAIEVEVLPIYTIKALDERLLQQDKPIHILHFNGYAIDGDNEDSTNQLVFENDKGTADFYHIKNLAGLLGRVNIDTVILDIAHVLGNTNEQNALSSELALSLVKNGVNNVITSGYASYNCLIERLYNIFYSLIAQGKTVAEAANDTRNMLKDNSKQTILTAQELDFIGWPLILYYSKCNTAFFAEEVEAKPLIQSKGYAEIMGNILGFNHEFLIPNKYFGRNKEKTDIEKIFRRNQVALLKGIPGIGKTHFVHQFAYWSILEKHAEKAFYFNFESGILLKNQIIQIIGEVLDGKETDAKVTMNKILKQHFLIIFDNFGGCSENQLSKTLSKSDEEFFRFTKEISEGNSRVIITNRFEIGFKSDNIQEIEIKGLNIQDRRILSASFLKKNNKEVEEEYPGYYELIDFLKGHPYFTQNLLSYLGDINADKIKLEFEKILFSIVKNEEIFNKKSIYALFEYGWNKISNECQLVLLAFANLKGYITDGLPIAVDMKNGENTAGQELYDLLNIKKVLATAEVFNKGCKAGLYVKKQFGYDVNECTSDFLALKIKDLTWQHETLAKLDHIISKIYSLELRVISSFLSQNPNQILYQKVVENNRRWFKALELLWNKKDYQYFINGKYFLASILNKVGMKSEVDAWNLNLVKSSDFESFIKNYSVESAIAWLKTANDALDVKNISTEKTIKTSIKYWEQCLVKEKIKEKELFDNIIMFLESYYHKIKDWKARKKLSKISISFYEKTGNYERVITAMMSWAKCEDAMGNVKECKKIENDILSKIPYEKTAEGTKEGAMINIAVNHMQRKEYKEAFDLTQKIKQMPNIKKVHNVADNIEGEIFYIQQKFEDATACYARVWREIMKGGCEYNQKVIGRLKELSEKVNNEKYSEIFAKEAPDVKSPFELGSYNSLPN